MKNEFYDVIEICLQELEEGTGLNDVLARHPEYSEELRPILHAAVAARQIVPEEPSQMSIVKGRSKVLMRAVSLRDQRMRKSQPVFAFRQRLSYALMILLLMLGSSFGLVSASSKSLPGDNLYPVKRTWEGVQLSLIFNPDSREILENEFKQYRLDEAGELLLEGREAEVNLMGVVSIQNGEYFISGLPVSITTNTQGVLNNGETVLVSGQTDAQGVIVLSVIQVLPQGSFVPLNVRQQGTEQMEFKIVGVIESMSDTVIIVNQQVVYLQSATVIEGKLAAGVQVEVEGVFSADGRFVAVQIEVDNEDVDNEPQEDNSGSSGGDSSDGDDDGGGNSGND